MHTDLTAEEKLHSAWESQAGLAGVETIRRNPKLFQGAMIVVHTIGMEALGLGEFAGSMIGSAGQRDQWHAAALPIAGVAAYRAAQDLARRGDRRGKQLEFALKRRVPEALGQIATEQPERVLYDVTGGRDLVSPPSVHYQELIKESAHLGNVVNLGEMLRVIPDATHSTPASPAGARQSALVAEQWTRDVIPRYQPGQEPEHRENVA